MGTEVDDDASFEGGGAPSASGDSQLGKPKKVTATAGPLVPKDAEVDPRDENDNGTANDEARAHFDEDGPAISIDSLIEIALENLQGD